MTSGLKTMARYTAFALVVLMALVAAILAMTVSLQFVWLLAAALPLAVLGVLDMAQTSHSLLRNYPVVAHLRWMFEGIRPEIRQYLIEGDDDTVPFSRDQRTMVYQRAKNVLDNRPFGTDLDVYRTNMAWLNHSMAPAPVAEEDLRLTIGGEFCTQPYSASIYNISAMSFGALSGNAIMALNKGASIGGFAHDTGEGSISRYHREHGGDLIWEIGSGYFGCRTHDGKFDPDSFAAQAASDQVRLIEIKLSQGAKPGHGGVLPGAKVTPEIAEARHIPLGVDCNSPASHSAFSTPIELVRFIALLRELSGGKPVGFKLCIGHRWEFLAICKAMLETGIRPDFIVVDGAEGGTGAAPPEFVDHMGTPMRVGLSFVHNALVGCGLRGDIRIGASGKIVSAYDIVLAMALGADWCNAARGFMFALGCVQAQSCHTNRCPVGVATQDALRQKALNVEDKSRRVASFHKNTVQALAEILAAVGVERPGDLKPRHISVRDSAGKVISGSEYGSPLHEGELTQGTDNPLYARYWRLARASTFAPTE